MIKNIKEDEFSFGSIKEKLFTFKELETLLNLRPFTNDKRFIFIKSRDRRFRWSNNCWATDVNCWPVSLIKKLTKEGTCYLRDCSRANSKINNVANQLEEKFNSPVDCHIYFSLYQDSASFDKHKDESHNFIVACEGEIKFEIFLNELDKQYSNNTNDFFTLFEQNAINQDLRLPRYFINYGTTKDQIIEQLKLQSIAQYRLSI